MKKYIIIGIIIGISIVGFSSFVYANPSYFVPTYATATATTSPAYMTPGTATTTLTFDAYDIDQTDESRGFNPTVLGGLSLAVQYTGSSTDSKLNWQYEFSDDGIDWYWENIETNTNATTTQVAQSNRIYEWPFASSTSITGGSSDRAHKLITVPTPTRYIRTHLYLPVGSTNGAIWAEFIPIKQRSE